MNDATIIVTILAALGALLFAVAARLSEALVRARARRLPTRIALRMEEEWLGELNAIPSRPGKLAFAIALTLTRRRAFASPGEDSMTEIHDRPAGWLGAFNGRKTLLILPTLIFAIAGYGASFLLPVRYGSESLILIKPREVPASFVVDPIAGSVEERLKSIEQTVMSRTNLVAILREFSQLKNGRETWPMDRRIEDLRKDITVLFGPSTGSAPSFFRLRYVGPDPVLTQKVASKLTLLFVERDGSMRESQVAGTRDFLQRQLDSIGERLTQKGNDLALARAAHDPETARLAFDYELLASTYRSVFAKHEDAEMTAALESEQKGGQFQVVDPANLPTTPVSPNRLAIAGIGAFAGLLIGGTAVVGLNRRRRRALA